METFSEEESKEREKRIQNEEMGIEEPEEEHGELDDVGDSDDSLDDVEFSEGRRELDVAMQNELMLVCSNIGTIHEGDDGVSFVASPDCVEWIHDLQRAIRRDDARHRLVGLKLGAWGIVQKKLLPLLMNHQDDW